MSRPKQEEAEVEGPVGPSGLTRIPGRRVTPEVGQNISHGGPLERYGILGSDGGKVTCQSHTWKTHAEGRDLGRRRLGVKV